MAFGRVVLLSLTLPTCVLGAISTNIICPCKFIGAQLPASIYDNFPDKDPAGCTVGAADATKCKKYPGMYKDKAATKYYGSNCAAWDQIPDTPWHSYCESDSIWSDKDYNWCQQPWCYVDESCADKVPSATFKGSPAAFYSYLSCGNTADCYTNIAWEAAPAWPTGCPYDPYGGESYKVHKAGDCACVYQGDVLKPELYDNFPIKQPADCTIGSTDTATMCDNYPGMYKTAAAIKYYGSTCAAWDQMPGTPWFSYCPASAKWCSYDANWCQQPWCYVKSTCATGVASSVFRGSTVAFYSYDTCLGTPDCYTNVAFQQAPKKPTPPAACPFDSSDNNWYTAGQCPNGWDGGTGGATTGPSVTGSTHKAELAAATMATVMVAFATQA